MSQFRVYAKAVAIFDLVLSIISTLMVIGLVIVVAMTAVKVNEKNYQDEIQQQISPNHNAAVVINAVILIYIACVAVFALFTAIQMWAAVRLMSATDICREPVEALRLATTWRNVSIALLTLGIVGLLGPGKYIWVWVAVSHLLRGAMIYIVFRYIEELMMKFNTPFPVSVTVQK